MYRFIMMTVLGALLPAVMTAAQLTVNAPALKDIFSNDAILPVVGADPLAFSETMIVRTSATFTLPTQTPDFAAVRGDKLAVAADIDGTVLVADATGWIKSSVKVADGETVAIEAIGRTTADSKLQFDVKLTRSGQAPETVQVTSPASNAATSAVTEMVFSGMGSATDISVAQVKTGILPAPEGGYQDPAQVDKYVAWANDANKGKKMADASEEAQQNAFAMNVGGTPKLEITAVDTAKKTITVHGAYVPKSGETLDAPLDKINGTLYLTYSDSLSGMVHVTDQAVTVAADGDLTVTLPKGAVFVKATVSLVKPPATLTK